MIGFNNSASQTYDDKAPSGEYLFKAIKYFEQTNGHPLDLNGATSDVIQIFLRDDFTDLSQFTITIGAMSTRL